MTTHVPEELPLTPLTMALLLALGREDLHGYALMQEVERQSGGALTPGTGSLYAALERLVDEGLIDECAPPEGRDRRRKYYAITERGRAAARAETARLQRVVELARERDLGPGTQGLAGAGGDR